MLDEAFFVSDKVHAREVKLSDGKAYTLHFKELPAIEFRKYAMAQQSNDEDARAASMNRLIAASLCDAAGKPALTPAQALKLRPDAANAIATEVLAINGLGDAGKALPPGTSDGSGTSSPSPLAAEA